MKAIMHVFVKFEKSKKICFRNKNKFTWPVSVHLLRIYVYVYMNLLSIYLSPTQYIFVSVYVCIGVFVPVCMCIPIQCT